MAILYEIFLIKDATGTDRNDRWEKHTDLNKAYKTLSYINAGACQFELRLREFDALYEIYQIHNYTAECNMYWAGPYDDFKTAFDSVNAWNKYDARQWEVRKRA